ncbi:MAG: LuxR C-terminal-related transcriptional regulator [Actinomycetota bacterium]
MTRKDPADTIARAEDALRERDFERAREGFQAAVDAAGDAPEALDGLARALWWLGDVDGAIHHRERAYAMLRRRGDRAAAARIALWISREYVEAVGNAAAGNGWLARAEGLLRDAGTGPERGWLELTRGSRATEPSEMRARAEGALAVARASEDTDLEASALALLGRALLLAGEVERGVASLDEAMTAITGSEVADPLAFGDVCCVVTLACEESGELGRLMQWNDVVNGYLARNPHGALLSFCGTCGAEFFRATGDLAMVEECLVFALQGLEGTGHRSRCVHPAARLAELRVMQGRIEEAERLLQGYEDLPESLRGLVAIHRARGEHAVAAALLLRQVNRMGDTVAAVAFLASLVEVQLDAGDPAAAATTALRVGAIAEETGHPRVRAAASLAAGRVARTRGDHEARVHLEAALEAYVALEMPLDAAHARVELALALRDEEPQVALRESRLAVEAFERVGAAREADRAARVVRELGGPARTGPKLLGLLTAREREVLGLLGEGLSNPEIGARLYISTKTAGNHVSSVLSKLQLRSRQEAAAYAVRHAEVRAAK